MLRFIIYGIFLSVSVTVEAQDSIAIRFSEMINSENLKKHVEVLASDSLEGRETGKPGQKKAADYIQNHFKEISLTPVNDTYIQSFPLVKSYPEGVKLNIGSSDFIFKKDMYYFSAFDGVNISNNRLIFAGYGINDEKFRSYIDSSNIKGQVVMLLEDEPKDRRGNYILTGYKEKSDWGKDSRKKISTLKVHEPSAIIIVLNDFKESYNKVKHWVEQPVESLELNQTEKPLPVFYISAQAANNFLYSQKLNVKKLEKQAKKNNNTLSVINLPVLIDANRIKETVTGENVYGFIEGKNRKDEIVVVTAHYDHLGWEDGKIHYGADDNASGTSAIMEIARVFKAASDSGNKPARSLLFMAVSGEEKGLFGSEYYVKNPLFPLTSKVANLNVDMIGRIDEKHDHENYIYLIGSDRLSTTLHNISEYANSTYTNIDLDYTFNDTADPNRFYYRSDHYNFAKNNIPVIFYFSGVHEDYHKPTDTPDKLSYSKIEKISKLIFFTAWEIANYEGEIEVDKQESKR